MARKAKLKKGDAVTHNGWVMFLTKDQYLFRNKSVVDIKDGETAKTRVPLADVVPYKIEEPITNTVLCGSVQQVTDACAPNPDGIKTVTETLDERGARYGDFTDHARIAQQLQDVMRQHTVKNHNGESQKNWHYLSAVQKQALTVLADKIARILNGDPNYTDNWHDIQGYAKLVEDRLPKAE
jgi:hypothetical protein